MTNQDKWGKPSPVLAVAAEDGGLVGLMQNGEVILVPSIDPPIFNRVVGDQFIVVTPKEIYTGTLDAVMSAVQRAVTR